LALAVPLLRFAPRVGGGSVFYVLRQDKIQHCAIRRLMDFVLGPSTSDQESASHPGNSGSVEPHIPLLAEPPAAVAELWTDEALH